MKRFNTITLLTLSVLVAAQPRVFSLNRAPLDSLEKAMEAGKYEGITSMLVAVDGEMVWEKYTGQTTAETLHNTRSVTKTITGMLVGCMIQDGTITSANTTVSDAIPTDVLYPDPRKTEITVKDLLTMSSCLECDDWNELSRGQEERMYLVEDWNRFFWDLPIKGFPDWVKKPSELPHGRSFSYCTAGCVALGSWINYRTGNLEQYAYRELFAPLGIQSYRWQYTPTGLPMTGGGLQLTTRDLYKMGQLYLNGGSWNNQQIVPKQWVEQSTLPQVRIDFGPGYDYGYLWWIGKFAGESAYFMTGTGGNKVIVFPRLNAVVVVTSINFNGGMKSHQQTDEIVSEYAIPALLGY